MSVQAEIGEIDIGHVRAGQAARVFPRAAPGVDAARPGEECERGGAGAVMGWRSNRLPGKKVFSVVLPVLDFAPEAAAPGMTADFEWSKRR